MLNDTLRRLIGEPDFSRGLDYVRRGMVDEVDIIDEGFVSGVVSGSGHQFYEQDIELIYQNGKLRRISGECTCPVGFNCKHVAAVMLVARDDLQKMNRISAPRSDVRGTAIPQTPVDVQLWLSHLSDQPSAPPKRTSAKEKIFYLFGQDVMNRPKIQAYKIRLLKSGDLSKVRSEYNSALVGNGANFLDLIDAGILQKLSFLSSGYPRVFEWPEGQGLYEFLREIIATGRARGFDLEGPELFWSTPRAVRFDWTTTDKGAQQLSALTDDGQRLSLLGFTPPIYIDKETGACGEIETALDPVTATRCAMAPEVPAHAVDAVSHALSQSNTPSIPRPSALETTEREVTPQPVLMLLNLPAEVPDYARYHRRDRDLYPSEMPVARVRFDYAGHSVTPGTSENPTFVEGEKLVAIKRDHAAEGQALRLLEQTAEYGAYPYDPNDGLSLFIIPDAEENDLVFSPDYDGIDPLTDTNVLAFTAEFVPQLRDQGWRVEIADNWPIRLYEGALEFEARAESSGIDWFSLAVTLQADGEEIDLIPTITAIINALPVTEFGELEADFDLDEFLEDSVLYPTLKDGRRIPVTGEWLIPVVRAFLEVHGLTGFHLAEAGRAAQLAQALEGCGIPWQGGQELLALGERLRALSDAQDAAPPQALQAELRPYQRTGYGWLDALSETGFGGVLADDMGLGKTLQALALLVSRHVNGSSDRPSLVVVPTSLIGNWQREAARFARDLSLLVLHGPDRKQHFDTISDHHVIVTTYPLIHRDHETLFEHEFDVVILDEAQAIKNPASSVAKRIRDVRARQRIALTGTPMENNLIELWALFDWLIPGLLGNRASFTKIFRTPIEKHNDQAKQKLLSARLKPFLLRRTKEEVADDLPPKTLIDEIVPLSDDQRRLYETLRVAMDSRVKTAIAKKGLSGSHITILDALLKLRQVCCDPSLVKLDAARAVKDSAKRARLLALLEELVAEGRKVLVFSQFVGMLKLLEADIQAQGWGYSMLTGQTKKRDALIQEFQDGDNQLFLISLKAGGVGLNLTAADTVVLYDPWWNPAVERQAMDRAHRIGQTKPVFVYRLIAEGTVEAAIQQMQAAKQSLADALFEGDKNGPLALAEEDITALFAPLE